METKGFHTLFNIMKNDSLALAHSSANGKFCCVKSSQAARRGGKEAGKKVARQMYKCAQRVQGPKYRVVAMNKERD